MRPTKAARIAKAAQDNDNMLAQHITSLAIAVESIETLLVEQGIIEDGDVMKKIKDLIEKKKLEMGK